MDNGIEHMKALPPTLVLFATAFFTASFGACGTENSELGDRSQSTISSASDETTASDTASAIAPTIPIHTTEQSSSIPQIPPTIGSGATIGPENLQTDPAFIPKRSYATSVTSVTDGDTIRATVDGKQTSIRLIGIDTPESSTSTRPEECGGEEATQFLRSILPKGTPILLTRDQELLDPYDRLLAYVFRKYDGLFVNLAIAKYGMADELSFPPNTLHASHIRKAVTAARTSGAGVWGLCSRTA